MLMNRIFIASGIVGLSVVLVAGVYFFGFRNKPDDLNTQQNKLEEALTVAQGKLSKAKDKLSVMTDDLSSYFFFGVSVQDQIVKATEVVKQTNFLFNDPDGENPEFIVKDLSAGKLINDERKEINLLLSDWQKKMDVLALRKIDAKEAEQIKKDAKRIKTFIQNLYKIVKNLTPENSGFSQTQINIYLLQLPSTTAIDEILDSISASIVIENRGNTSVNAGSINSQTDSAINEDNNTETGEVDTANSNTESTSTSVPSVTPEEVAAQQAVVREAEREVEAIQQQITQVQEQIQQTPPPAPIIPEPAPIPIVPPPQPEIQNINILPGRRVIIPTTTIIIQPGPPRLIQGMDEF